MLVKGFRVSVNAKVDTSVSQGQSGIAHATSLSFFVWPGAKGRGRSQSARRLSAAGGKESEPSAGSAGFASGYGGSVDNDRLEEKHYDGVYDEHNANGERSSATAFVKDAAGVLDVEPDAQE
ncbi:hypothetical protein LEL_05738 [Akanthomyces lecanii RCEF 1005]|uniref:Uncharacterized protein n=1 Tax=Akanthomyces lecanii RCEF 1005 TaxID=1081108 RepID=A0A168G5I7_CORDF|nr:hypothetical protein LEL_05738 [Akanthomyces lecanii RCEF 1005]